MHYNMRKIFCTTALALILGLTSAENVWAQAKIALADNANSEEIPDEISLFGEESDDILVPAKANIDTPQLGTSSDIITPAPSAEPMPLQNDSLPMVEEDSDVSIGMEQPTQINNAPLEIKVPSNNYNTNTQPVPVNPIGSPIMEEIDDNVFSQMSDLEKQTAVLNLELRRERVKNEIDALKNVREKAIDEEKSRQEEEKRKRIEWEKEQERKLLKEQQKLRELDIKYEQTRQEKQLKAYKNEMLENQQKWVKANIATYQEIADLKKERQKIINDFKGKFIQLTQMADQSTKEAIRARDNYAKTISDLQTQISILRARLEANEKTNPFADGANASASHEEEAITNFGDLYAVMEIRGKGENLSAKLINDKGLPFIVRIGTALQSGHVVDEITSTFVRASKDGNKEYLYFSAGGALEKEPIQNEELKIRVREESSSTAAASKSIVTSNGIPGVAREMTIR